MSKTFQSNQILTVENFEDLIATPFAGEMNAVCWNRTLSGNFSEIIEKLITKENITEIKIEALQHLELTIEGQAARKTILDDMKLLEEFGASPVLNIIRNYQNDSDFLVFPTDVYSFHVDRSPIPTSTFLCTYFGAASEILPNDQGIQKILIPEYRTELRKLFDGPDEEFEAFLTEYFFDLHYQANVNADLIDLGVGNLWKLAVDYPNSLSIPCIHRAPLEKTGENRLLLIS